MAYLKSSLKSTDLLSVVAQCKQLRRKFEYSDFKIPEAHLP